MPRKPKKPRQPSYRLHRPSGQAVVTIDGKDRYLGPHGSPESHREYAEWIAKWQAINVSIENPAGNLSVNELLEICWHRHFQPYHTKNGKLTTEGANLTIAIRNLSAKFGLTRASDFGPKKLKELRTQLIAEGYARSEINKRIGRIKRIFKFAVSEELVPATIFQGLQAVAGLRLGENGVRESAPVTTVPDLYICATLPFLSRQVATMVVIQRLTGMRPTEVTIMRRFDLDMTGPVWEYRPSAHKKKWLNHKRVIFLGPEAQRRLQPFLARPADAYLFSPAEAENERSLARRNARTTPMTPSQSKRTSIVSPKRPKSNKYSKDSYYKAIQYAVAKAKRHGFHIPNWFPYQLRHNHATEVRRVFGVEAAQVALGQARTDVIEVYAEKNLDLANSVAKRMG